MACSCGYEHDDGCEGCGEVIDERVYRDDDGEITDTEWIHCGQYGELCDECEKAKRDAVYTEGEENETN